MLASDDDILGQAEAWTKQGKGVALAHVAKACDKDTDHLTAPAVMPRINCREKIR